MTTPPDPLLLDEAAVRAETTRVFSVCGNCRRCVDRCGVFPTLFDLLDQPQVGGDAGLLTPEQQDCVVDECFHCTRCLDGCPFGDGRVDDPIDVPRLVLRSLAMQRSAGHRPWRTRVADAVLARRDLVGRVLTSVPTLVPALGIDAPGSRRRGVLARLTGLSARRRLLGVAGRRFSTWFRSRPGVRLRRRQAAVTVFPTCLVEYHDPAVGRDLVRVYERNGIECSIGGAGCCGAPALHSGDVRRFRRAARRTVAALVDDVESGRDVVVPQPVCRQVMVDHYPDHVGEDRRADAERVISRLYDASEYLMSLHRSDGYVLDLDVDADHVPDRIGFHASCHAVGRRSGDAGRDLMRLLGARVTVVHGCSGTGSRWGLRRENDEAADAMGERLGDRMARTGGSTMVSDCLLSATLISERTGSVPVHPLTVLARAYGLDDA